MFQGMCVQFYLYKIIVEENKSIKLLIATLGPTWEFQLCLKSCKLASWTTKWHDSATGTTHPPPALVENCFICNLGS